MLLVYYCRQRWAKPQILIFLSVVRDEGSIEQKCTKTIFLRVFVLNSTNDRNNSEPVLLNVYGAPGPELIPRNEFRQPM
jgi:hypothetical protein